MANNGFPAHFRAITSAITPATRPRSQGDVSCGHARPHCSNIGEERKPGKMESCPRPAVETETKHQQLIRDELLTVLARHYERDLMAFVALPPLFMDSALAREVVAQLRNEGYIEEKMRGTIRLTARGHMAFRATGLRARLV